MLLWMVGAAAVAATPLYVDGGVPKGAVEDVLRWHANDVNECFGNAPKHALLKYRFGIAPEGTVESIGFIDSKGLEGSQVTCLGAHIEKMAFPAADAGTSVTIELKRTPGLDAGMPELEMVPPAELRPEWRDGLFRCHWMNQASVDDGRMTLELWAAPSGTVVQATVSDPTTGLQVKGFLPCVTSAARGWRLERSTAWRHLQLSVIIGRTNKAQQQFFDPKAPAVFVKASGTPAPPGLPQGLNKDVIYDVIRSHQQAIKRCYEARLQPKPELAGKVTLAFRIEANGKVTEVNVEGNSTGDEPLAACMVEHVRTWEFPEPIGGGFVNVTFPWIFRSVEAD